MVQSPTVLTLHIQETVNHQSASIAETHEQVSSSALHFQMQWYFLREALCVDVDSHSTASLSAIFFVAFSFQVLASWSGLLLLPKRGILIDDKEYKGNRMITNNQIARWLLSITAHCLRSATIVDGGLWV